MRCPSCGEEAGEDSRFCPKCGFSNDGRATMPQQDYGRPLEKPTSKTAITVTVTVIIVLSFGLIAVLYFLVSPERAIDGFSTPAATYRATHVQGGVWIHIISITRTDVPWDDVTVQLTDSSAMVQWSPRKTDLRGTGGVTAEYGARSLGDREVNLSVTDSIGNGYVSGSDSFTLISVPAFSSGVTYNAHLLYKPTGEQMGTGATFKG